VKIGAYTLHPIETGRFYLDGGAMFGIIPRPLWEKTNPPDARNRIELASRALLVIGNGRNILIDNGNGPKFTEKQIDIYGLDTSTSELHSSLRAKGLSPSDITDVILTHLHFDHAGGSTQRENGKLVPTFPNATYYVQRAHWEQAVHPTEKDRGSFMPDDFLPLNQHGVIRFVEGEIELFPQISLIVTNGHTTAQQLPKIADGERTLLYCCDLFPTASHVPLPYIMAYDLRPLTTLDEKKRVLASAVDNDWMIFFEHDPRNICGKVKRTEKGFSFDAPVPFD